jgi:hypothetical protein
MSATEHLTAKRRRSTSEHSERACKIQRVQDPQTAFRAATPQQLPSPFSARHTSFEDHTSSLDNPAANQKRKAESLDADKLSRKRSRRRPRKLSQTDDHPSSVDEWLSNVPETFEDMSQPPSKRSRSTDTLRRRLSQSSNDDTETTVSRDAKYSVYKDVNYPMVLETKNSYMRASPTGLIDQDRKLCDMLLHENQSIPQNSMFDADKFEGFCSHLRGRSEARVYLHLHPLLVPSPENLFVCGHKNLEYLIEGYNDRWVKAIPFYGKRPQPDHTVGLKWLAFTESQRRKLDIDLTSNSYYMAREDIYFPFLTTEVKCGKSVLDLADRANTNSMTIAVRGVVELFRKIGRPMDVHRRALGFSISYDENVVRLYAHYPEIDGDKTSFWRYTIEDFTLRHHDGENKWTCYTFTRNIYEKFVPVYLKVLQRAIDQLPDPLEASFESAITATDEESALSSQEIPSSQESEFRKPRQTRGLNAELRTMIQNLQKQLEKQREESKQQLELQQKKAEQQLELQQKKAEQQLELQQKQAEKQREESKHQLDQLTLLLQQQSEQLNQLLKR